MPTTSASNTLRLLAEETMRERGLQPEFPPEAIAQLAGTREPTSFELTSVRDLRHLLWCSIDNAESRDLDQLTVAERLPTGEVRVLVAIADVDALVPIGTPIDRHAAANTVSVYTAAVIFPMLPERLSTDLTSLGEGADRLAVVTDLVISPDGSMRGWDIYRAVVRNQAKLAYDRVAPWLEGAAPLPEEIARVPGLEEQLQLQDETAHILRRVRHEYGALDLEMIQPEVLLRDGRMVQLRAARQNRAQKLIEDFMVTTNSISARFLEKKGWPAFRRIVRSPERWDKIQKVAQELGDSLPETPDSRALAEFLARRRAVAPQHYPDLSLTIVKLMGAGEYVVQNPGEDAPGHFGLAVREYSHSTAPNRRFPDLVTQRLLKCALTSAAVPYSVEALADLAVHCTKQEDAARKVERKIRKSAEAQFLADRVGETFEAMVTGVTNRGTWVRLLDPPVEGKLETGPVRVDVGDQLPVQLVRLDVQRGFIDFVPVPLRQ